MLPVVLVGAMYYGVAGIIAARLSTALVVAGCSAIAVRELIEVPVRTQVFSQWRSILSGFAMALAITPMAVWLANVRGLLPLAVGLALAAFVAISVYVASIFALWRLSGCPEGFESKIAKVIDTYRHKDRRP